MNTQIMWLLVLLLSFQLSISYIVHAMYDNPNMLTREEYRRISEQGVMVDDDYVSPEDIRVLTRNGGIIGGYYFTSDELKKVGFIEDEEEEI